MTTKTKIDYTKRNKIIRSRGYRFEHKIVQILNEAPDWEAKRLGGTTTTMPDIAAQNNTDKTFVSIECKSTADNKTHIEKEQIERCISMCESQPHKFKFVVFAFKFKRAVSPKAKKVKPLKYYIFAYELANARKILYVKCNRQGEIKTYFEQDGKLWSHIHLPYNFMVEKPESLPFVFIAATGRN